MKITKVTAKAVNIPFKTPYKWSVGTYTGITRVIIEVQTDEGIIGYGESPSWESEEEINTFMAQRLLGKDPLDMEACERACVPEMMVLANTDGNTPLKSFGGIEMALWDIKGKFFKLPLYMLLGGAVRKKIPMCEYFSYRMPNAEGTDGGETTPKDVADYCARMRDTHGSTYFEGKCFTGNVKAEVEMIREIRAALGEDAMIRLDGNMAWSISSARELLRGIEPYNIRNFEDPVGSFWDMKKLRQHSAIPFSTHNPDPALAFHLGVPDSFVVNLTVLGGLRKTIGFINTCENMGLNVWCYSGDTGLATAGYLHVKAAIRHMHEPSQSLFRFMEFDVIEEGPFSPVDNLLDVPEGHGLGVHIDHENVEYGHKLYKENGPMDQFYNEKTPNEFLRLPVN